ncbi:hypothetical protein L0Y65_06125 [Candidatus Micrarchaeota archaeon]|nr:hypothetical protein [Candidatus Micrarchaeota archaeon]
MALQALFDGKRRTEVRAALARGNLESILRRKAETPPEAPFSDNILARTVRDYMQGKMLMHTHDVIKAETLPATGTSTGPRKGKGGK